MKLEEFTNLYQLSKTLRFELIPQGNTLSNMEKNAVLQKDTARAESYKKMKETIDAYHKAFIDRALSSVVLNGLNDFYELYTASPSEKKEKKWKTKFDKCKEALRSEIVSSFKAQEDYTHLFKKELINALLKQWIAECSPDSYFDPDFEKFTTYFIGYNKNRKNMYSEEAKATAIAYRLIDENLSRFIDNLAIYEKIRETGVADCFEQLCAENNVSSLDDVFSLSHFSELLTQIQIDHYNLLINGKKEEAIKRQGLNEYINLYNQKHPAEQLPQMKPLYKQILSERNSLSWLPASFRNAAELLKAVRNFSEDCTSLIAEIGNALGKLSQCDAGKIYVSEDALSKMSNAIFGQYSILPAAYGVDESKKNRSTKKEEKIYVSFAALQEKLDRYAADTEELTAYSPSCLTDYFEKGLQPMAEALQAAKDAVLPLFKKAEDEACSLTQNDKDRLKNFLDRAMDILHFAKPLYLPTDFAQEKDDVFYGEFAPLYDRLVKLTTLYDEVRNFATKKPYSTEKVKLNFGNPQFLKGWFAKKERDYSAILLRSKKLYYLGVIDVEARKEIKNYPCPLNETDIIEKMFYYQVADPSKDIQNLMVVNGKTVRKTGRKEKNGEHAGENLILEQLKCDNLPKDINRIRRSKSYIVSSENFSRSDLTTYIEYYMERAKEYFSQYRFCFKAPEDYENFMEFTDDIDIQAFQIQFKKISAAYIDKLVHTGKLYLFQIYNKDFSPYSKGKPNLHTMYWRALFDKDNLKDVIYKLNGEAEMFYRVRSIAESDKIVHPAHCPIEKKNPDLAGENSLFPYEITKDRRYTVDKFQLHVPITLNFKARGTVNLNSRVYEYIKNNPDVHILGIDRGERNLLYISLIDRNGHVVKDEKGRYIQYSLNEIDGTYRDSAGNDVKFSTPYQKLLTQREKEREEARESWSSIESIKELKAGYLSQVVHHIAGLVVKYNAIIVMEDLNSGFKRGRFKVERQVYQNFEKALIEKLNYLVFKDVPPDAPGGLYHALQLTEKVDSFKEMTKQCGFIFYVPAWNTSKIDPVTGFVDVLKPQHCSSAMAAIDFFGKFRSIVYDTQRDCFAFAFNSFDFSKKEEDRSQNWTVCTCGELRYVYDRTLNNNRGGYEKRNVTEHLKKLFSEHGIAYADGSDLKESICAQSGWKFFKDLLKNLQIVLALRYSSPEDGKDFILSPVEKNGVFFCSEGRTDGLPQDADANGAFNIARKGLWVLRQIDGSQNDRDWTTKISNREWLSFVQSLSDGYGKPDFDHMAE